MSEYRNIKYCQLDINDNDNPFDINVIRLVRTNNDAENNEINIESHSDNIETQNTAEITNNVSQSSHENFDNVSLNNYENDNLKDQIFTNSSEVTSLEDFKKCNGNFTRANEPNNCTGLLLSTPE